MTPACPRLQKDRRITALALLLSDLFFATCLAILFLTGLGIVLDITALAGLPLPVSGGSLHLLSSGAAGVLVLTGLQRGSISLSKASASLASTFFLPKRPVFDLPDDIRELLCDWMISEGFPLDERYRIILQVDLSRRPLRLQVSITWKGKFFWPPKIPDVILDRIEARLTDSGSLLALHTWKIIDYIQYPVVLSAHDRLRARRRMAAMGLHPTAPSGDI